MGVGNPKICSFIKSSEIHDSFLFCFSTAPSFPDLVFFHPSSLFPYPLLYILSLDPTCSLRAPHLTFPTTCSCSGLFSPHFTLTVPLFLHFSALLPFNPSCKGNPAHGSKNHTPSQILQEPYVQTYNSPIY